jgi:tetratricopeptide (TPR) repeat protein
MVRPERLFVSVAGPDRAWARWIGQELRRAGHEVELDEWSWAPGASLIASMENALLQADRVVMILSPDYFVKSSYATEEREAALVSAHAHDGVLLPIMVRHCILPPFLARLTHLSLINCEEDEARRRLVTAMTGVSPPPIEEQIPWPGLQTSAPFPGQSTIGTIAAAALSARRVMGRGKEIAALASPILGQDRSAQIILGGPGIGKTTIAHSALFHSPLVDKFNERRYLIRCDGATEALLLWELMWAGLGGARNVGRSPLPDRVMGALQTKASVLVLDNFETPWQTDTVAAEEILGRLEMVSGLHLLLTIRGETRPVLVQWDGIHSIKPLPQRHAQQLFLSVAGKHFAKDPDMANLVAGMDGVPLAIELLGHAAQGQPNLRSVRERWRHRSVAILQRNGGQTRELSVSVSIEASIRNPYMTPKALRFLTILGQLPDGLAHTDFRALLADDAEDAAATLRQLGLAFDENARLRTLAPVREYVAQSYPPSDHDLLQVVRHYCELAGKEGWQVGSQGGARSAQRLLSDTGNLNLMLRRAVGLVPPSQLAEAILGLIEFMRFTGAEFADLIETIANSFDNQAADVRASALIAEAQGDLALARAQHGAAVDFWHSGRELYFQIDDELGQANCTKRIADVHLDRCSYGAASAEFQTALLMYRSLGNSVGDANCQKRLGDIALARTRLTEAEDYFRRATSLYEGVGAALGVANCLKCIGDIEMDRYHPNQARELYERAQGLFQDVGDRLGAANCLKRRADVAHLYGDFDEERRWTREALELYKITGSVLGVSNVLASRAWLGILEGRLDKATEELSESSRLYQDVGDLVGYAGATFGHGEISLRHHRLADALARFEAALIDYRTLGNQLGVANCRFRIADIARLREQYDLAADSYRESLSIYQSIQDLQGLVVAGRVIAGAALRSGSTFDGVDEVVSTGQVAETAMQEAGYRSVTELSEPHLLFTLRMPRMTTIGKSPRPH